jgi:hypothetical protein
VWHPLRAGYELPVKMKKCLFSGLRPYVFIVNF